MSDTHHDDVLRAAMRLTALLHDEAHSPKGALLALEAEGHITITAPTALTLVPVVATTDAATVYATAVVTAINQATGRSFKVTAETVTRAKALIRAKIKAEAMLAVVKLKAAKWGSDPKMVEYIQPSTLMRVGNAKKYIEAMEAGPARVRSGAAIQGFGDF